MTQSGKALADPLQVEDWAGEMGERWLANLDRFESMISPVGEALLEHAAFAAGERVVDIGCGGGATSLAVARAVLPGGRVLGIDISPVLAREAARRATSAGVSNVRFQAADAATVRLDEAPFDRLLSRFGSMFFADPPAAFANLARLLRQGGRADFSVWAPARENPWVAGLMQVVRRYVEVPKPQPGTPGPFSLDDPVHFQSLLAQAGFRDVRFELWEGQQLIGGRGADAAAAADFVLNAMSFGDLLKTLPAQQAAAAQEELRQLFAGHQGPEGVAMGANAWLVSAWR